MAGPHSSKPWLLREICGSPQGAEQDGRIHLYELGKDNEKLFGDISNFARLSQQLFYKHLSRVRGLFKRKTSFRTLMLLSTSRVNIRHTSRRGRFVSLEKPFQGSIFLRLRCGGSSGSTKSIPTIGLRWGKAKDALPCIYACESL